MISPSMSLSNLRKKRLYSQPFYDLLKTTKNNFQKSLDRLSGKKGGEQMPPVPPPGYATGNGRSLLLDARLCSAGNGCSLWVAVSFCSAGSDCSLWPAALLPHAHVHCLHFLVHYV